MTQTLTLSTLTAQAFAPFGDVLDVSGTPDKIINQGLCGRHHDRATLDFSDGRAGISLFNAEPRQFRSRWTWSNVIPRALRPLSR